MIVFSGEVSTEVEKHIFRKSRKLVHIAFSVAWFIVLIPIACATINSNLILFLYGYLAMLPILNLVILIPQSKSERRAMMPTKICIDNNYIEYTSKRSNEYRSTAKVKIVRDYGDFYDIVFPIGKICDFFVCQKDLLSCGTLEDFEKLFDGKIVRMAKSTK